MAHDLKIEADYQTFLDQVYAKAKISDFEEEAPHPQLCTTYGEMFTPSVVDLLHEMDYTSEDIFLDLGSGLGKLVLTLYLRSHFAKVIGIEGYKGYHRQAVEIFQNLRKSLPTVFTHGTCELIYGNFLDFDFNQATIVYTCSTCFTQELLWLIGEKINRSDHVKQVLSLKPIANLERLPFKKIIPVECSWDSAQCYLYAI